jgi:hypothetical protein
MTIPPKIKAGCGVATVFAAGALCGIISLFLLLKYLIPRTEGWKKEDSREFLAQHLARRIDLTDEQKKKLNPGFNEYLEQRWQLRANYLLEDRQLLEAYLTTIQPALTTAQIEKIKVLQERWWQAKKNLVTE